ncbi:MAG TPA: hypothetical protein VGC54_12985 [Planctomycetota bacterium]
MRRLVLLAPLLVACGNEPKSSGVDGVVVGLPESFEAFEAMLLDAQTLQLNFEIRSDEAVQAAFRGTLALAAGNYLRLDAAGSFEGAPMQLGLVSDGTMLRIRANGRTTDVPVPPELNKAVVLGLTRMGLLHNLAVLAGGAPPDHAAGGVGDWVRIEEGGVERRDASATFALRIFVAGEDVAAASLTLGDFGLPVHREQTVTFPGGQMQAREDYTEASINTVVAPERFLLD